MTPVTAVTKEVLEEDYCQEMSPFAATIYKQKYAHPGEEWADTAYRVTKAVMGTLGYQIGDEMFDRILAAIEQRKFLPGGRYLYAAGRPLHQVQNCLLMRAEDSREGWSGLLQKASMALMTGAGIGVDYSDVRPSGSAILKTGGQASGPISLMQMINECGRHIMQGGSRRSAIWAGLRWDHDDIMEFIEIKNWDKEVRRLKERDFNFPAPLDMTNISVLLNDEFFFAFENIGHAKHKLARTVYEATVKRMLKTAEPGFSVDVGENEGESLRNACTEVTSRDDSDICNLGSLNMGAIDSKEEFSSLVEAATLFLLAGTVYSHLPYAQVDEVRKKNRRLGLGVMGVHEWMLKRGYRYEPTEELGEWLEEYAQSTTYAHRFADYHQLSRPVKTRAIAPTGTIGIIAETTTGIEPIFCVAFKRRYLVGSNGWKYQFVIDPTAKRLIEKEGVASDAIEDAYSLSHDVERRIATQAFIQRYVDHGISSTINLPAPITEPTQVANFGKMIYDYLPQLRGITVYPDGARGGQPLTPVDYGIAAASEGVVFEEEMERCVGGVCGI